MAYQANTPISQPHEPGKFRNRKDMGGFGWHPDFGMYIPIVEKEDNITPPYISGMEIKKIPNTL